MKITEKLNERFCKDTNLPIRLFRQPWFGDRLLLMDGQYGCVKKWANFVELVESCGSEQAYFEMYNKVKDDAITYLKENEYMRKFNEDKNDYSIHNKGFSSHEIYHHENGGKCFVSFDMIKGNFTSLKHYDKRIVGGCDKYEDFLALFTEKSHLQQSKYIRQVIFGNLNPKRQITYEHFLMDKVLDDILQYFPKDVIKYFSADEIVLQFDEKEKERVREIANKIVENAKEQGIDIRNEIFKLYQIQGIEGYIKRDLFDGKLTIKCVNSFDMPFLIRKLNGEKPIDSDYVFEYDGKLSKFIECPEIKIDDLSADIAQTAQPTEWLFADLDEIIDMN